ncbi:unnamed protein product [Caenorhabditis sp. 36 PRJEB53466]|nr:unnamed protein product [Caenorhabditis sp. 36 PRJEB53466]
MTILPVKKKREKDCTQKAPSASGNEISRPSSGQSNSASKRNRYQEDGPPSKRWVMSPTNRHSASSSPRYASGSDEKKPHRNSQGRDYNSDDEYEQQNKHYEQQAAQLESLLKTRGLIIKEIVGDGSCMFRAIAEQVYGDQEMHGQIRKLCMDYMANNRDHFEQFMTENFESYVERKREDGVQGNHIELQAISEIFARPVEVYEFTLEPINVLNPRPEPDAANAPEEGAAVPPIVGQNPPFRLSYHNGSHYNAILDPNVPTIGVGLGLPGMVPGSADKDLMSKAIKSSELEHIEETMLQDKIGLSDFERTEAEMEDHIARESLKSYYQDLEKKHDSSCGAGPSTSAGNTSSSTGLYEQMLAAQSLDGTAFDDDDDDSAMARAMLASQLDYVGRQPEQRSGNEDGPSSSGSGPSN